MGEKKTNLKNYAYNKEAMTTWFLMLNVNSIHLIETLRVHRLPLYHSVLI